MSFRPPSSFATRVLPAVLCTAAIFYGGLIRLGPLPQVGQVPADKLGHALVFGALTALLASAYRYLWPSHAIARSVALSVATASGLGALLEFCQMFVSYRSAEFMDWVADTIGALFIGLLLQASLRRPSNVQ